jgi:hypothetical protein
MLLSLYGMSLITQTHEQYSSAKSKLAETCSNVQTKATSVAQMYLTREYVQKTCFNSLKAQICPWSTPTALQEQKDKIKKHKPVLTTLNNKTIPQINDQIKQLARGLKKPNSPSSGSDKEENVCKPTAKKRTATTTRGRQANRTRSPVSARSNSFSPLPSSSRSPSPISRTSSSPSRSPSVGRKKIDLTEARKHLEIVKAYTPTGKDETEQLNFIIGVLEGHFTSYEKNEKLGIPSQILKQLEQLATLIQQNHAASKRLSKIPVQIKYLNEQIKVQIGTRFIGWGSKAINFVAPGLGMPINLVLTAFSQQAQANNLEILPEDPMKEMQKRSVKCGQIQTLACTALSVAVGCYVMPTIRAQIGV